MATTTLSAIVSSLATAIEAGGVWARAQSGALPDELPAGDADSHFTVEFPEQLVPGEATGLAGTAAVDQLVRVVCRRLLAGDPLSEEPTLIDHARTAAHLVETATYPAGVDLVAIDSMRFSRDTADPSWGLITTVVRIRYLTAYP